MMPMGGMGGMGRGMGGEGAGGGGGAKKNSRDHLISDDPVMTGTWTAMHGVVGGVVGMPGNSAEDEVAPVPKGAGATDLNFGGSRW